MSLTKQSFIRFKLLQLCLVVYLLYFFGGLIDSGMLIFSNTGLFPNWAHPLKILNPIPWFDSELAFTGYWIILMVSSCLIFLNHWIIYLWLWLNWILIISLIPFYISPPNIGYVGFLFLCLTQLSIKNSNFYISTKFKSALWWVLGLSYTASGIGKILSPTWASGLTIETILQSPLGQTNFLTSLIISLPWLGMCFSFFALIGEVLSAPLMIFKKTRFIGLALMSLVHLGIFSLLNIQDIPLGLLIFHLFMFEDQWFKPKMLDLDLKVQGSGFWFNLLQKEDVFNIIKFASAPSLTVYYKEKEFKGVKAFFLALSYSNGFWRWLHLFIK